MFWEGCGNPFSLGRRAQDYDLYCVGSLSQGAQPGLSLANGPGEGTRLVLTGAALVASRAQGPQLAAEG